MLKRSLLPALACLLSAAAMADELAITASASSVPGISSWSTNTLWDAAAAAGPPAPSPCASLTGACVKERPTPTAAIPALPEGHARVFFLRDGNPGSETALIFVDGVEVAKIDGSGFAYIEGPARQMNLRVAEWKRGAGWESSMSLAPGQQQYIYIEHNGGKVAGEILFGVLGEQAAGGAFDVKPLSEEEGIAKLQALNGGLFR